MLSAISIRSLGKKYSQTLILHAVIEGQICASLGDMDFFI